MQILGTFHEYSTTVTGCQMCVKFGRAFTSTVSYADTAMMNYNLQISRFSQIHKYFHQLIVATKHT